ncbi:MAG TPA: HAD-IIA family hydrolase [Pseudonocardiaceae bacterium]
MTGTLLDHYDALLLDLDGTVFRGSEPIPGAAHAIEAARSRGVAVRFTTNNASRSPEQVAEHLRELGFPATADEVRTSAQAGAAVLADRLPAGSPVLVVGTDALRTEVTQAGLRVVTAAADQPTAVVQGHSPHTGWAQLAEACLAIRAGVIWVACNTDPTLPTERGQLPGNGAMVAALRTATGREPLVAGKPAPPLFHQAARSADAARPLVVGDRLDTDIAGARNAGLDALLVLTGVTTAADVLAAPAEHRPHYVAADLSAVEHPCDELRVTEQPGWKVGLDDGTLVLAATGGSGDPVAALRALCATWWAEGTGAVEVRAEDDAARAALAVLGLEPRTVG